ncbi:hypothetical protein Tco_1084798, partial [Tanacetum coccineum]
VVPVEEVYVEALQAKYPIIDWEIYFEDTRRCWRIIKVGNHTEAYQIFVEMLKKFDREDLVKLWDLVKERFNTAEPTNDKEKELWVELKRLFEPDNDDMLWKLQRFQQGVVDSGCSRHMTGNKFYLTDYQEIDGGFVAFGGGSKEGMITGKGNIKIGKLDFEDVYFVKELEFNLFSVSQMCDKKTVFCLLKINVLFFLLILSYLMKIKSCLKFQERTICTVLICRMLFLQEV